MKGKYSLCHFLSLLSPLARLIFLLFFFFKPVQHGVNLLHADNTYINSGRYKVEVMDRSSHSVGKRS